MDIFPLDNDLPNITIAVGDTFNNKKELKTKISMLCTLEIPHREHKQATSRIIGECIKSKSKFEGIARVDTPKEIQADVHQRFGVKPS